MENKIVEPDIDFAKKAVISLSGGLDSTCLLFELLAQGIEEIKAYSFKYGQKHSIELKKVKRNIKFLQEKGYKIEHHIIDLTSVFNESNSSLHEGGDEIPEGHYEEENMKSTVVENRNVIFSSIIYGKALSWANKTGENVYITLGVHRGDHCFTEDTNILTCRGNKTVRELQIGDRLPSFNTTTNKWEEDKVINIVNTGHPESVYEIKTSAGNIKLTEDHKVYRLKLGNFNPAKGYDKFIEKVPVKDLNETDYLIQPTGFTSSDKADSDMIDISGIFDDLIKSYKNVNIKRNNDVIWIGNDSLQCCGLPIKMNKKALVNLMAWYIAEGWSPDGSIMTSNANGNKFKAAFCQSLNANLDKVELITKTINDSGVHCRYHFSKVTHNDIPKEVTLYFSNAASILMQSCGHKAYDKYIPDWLMNILLESRDLREEFLYTMTLADGYHADNQVRGFCSVSEKLIEQMIMLLQLSGYHFSISSNSNKTTYISYSTLGTKSALISLGQAKFTQIKSITQINNDQDVYDITVEKNHNFCAGQYGSILISNCIYPDCRPEVVEASQKLFEMANWGSERVYYIAPFEYLDKGHVLMAGIESMEHLGFNHQEIKKVLKNTHTCYNPDKHGYACGECGSCNERLEAFNLVRKCYDWLKGDPAPYQ